MFETLVALDESEYGTLVRNSSGSIVFSEEEQKRLSTLLVSHLRSCPLDSTTVEMVRHFFVSFFFFYPSQTIPILVETLSVVSLPLKKDIIELLPELVGDNSRSVSAVDCCGKLNC